MISSAISQCLMLYLKDCLTNTSTMAYYKGVPIHVLMTTWIPSSKTLKLHRLFNLRDGYVYVHRANVSSAYKFCPVKALFWRVKGLQKCQVLDWVRMNLTQNKSILIKWDYSRVLDISKDIAPCLLLQSDVLIFFFFSQNNCINPNILVIALRYC